MLESRSKPPPPPDPDEVMVGTCGSCRTIIETTRVATAKPLRTSGFGDAPSAECPGCGARVYVAGTGKPAEAVEKAAKPPAFDPDASVMEKMLAALRKGHDLELTEADAAELDRLEREADAGTVTKFLMDE